MVVDEREAVGPWVQLDLSEGEIVSRGQAVRLGRGLV